MIFGSYILVGEKDQSILGDEGIQLTLSSLDRIIIQTKFSVVL